MESFGWLLEIGQSAEQWNICLVWYLDAVTYFRGELNRFSWSLLCTSLTVFYYLLSFIETQLHIYIILSYSFFGNNLGWKWQLYNFQSVCTLLTCSCLPWAVSYAELQGTRHWLCTYVPWMYGWPSESINKDGYTLTCSMSVARVWRTLGLVNMCWLLPQKVFSDSELSICMPSYKSSLLPLSQWEQSTYFSLYHFIK